MRRFLSACTRGVRALRPALFGLTPILRSGTESRRWDSNPRPPLYEGGQTCTAQSSSDRCSPCNVAQTGDAGAEGPEPGEDPDRQPRVRAVYARFEIRQCEHCGGRDHYPASTPLITACTSCGDLTRHEFLQAVWA